MDRIIPKILKTPFIYICNNSRIDCKKLAGKINIPNYQEENTISSGSHNPVKSIYSQFPGAKLCSTAQST